jgi:hypothetical protein
MYAKPTIGDLIEGVIISLNRDVMPYVQGEKAPVAVQVIQGVLVNVAQRAAMEIPVVLAEHNEMTAVFRDMAAILGDTPGPEAERIRERAATLGERADLPLIPSLDELFATYGVLSRALVDSIDDLDILIREGSDAAGEALLRLREHTGPRVAREFAANVAGAGMVGRG